MGVEGLAVPAAQDPAAGADACFTAGNLDLQVADDVLSVQMLQGLSAGGYVLFGGDLLGRLAPEVGIVDGQDLGQHRLHQVPVLEVEAVGEPGDGALDINFGLLNRLAERTGGQVLRPDMPAEAAEVLFATPGQSLSALRDYWPWFVMLALCLFIGEIAIRQILLPASWAARLQSRTAPSEPAVDYTYDELEAIVHRRAEEHRRRTLMTREVR